MSVRQIGAQIQKRRKALKIIQADLSEIAGVSIRTIKAIEKGEANPTIDVLSRILEPLGLMLVAAERVTHE